MRFIINYLHWKKYKEKARIKFEKDNWDFYFKKLLIDGLVALFFCFLIGYYGGQIAMCDSVGGYIPLDLNKHVIFKLKCSPIDQTDFFLEDFNLNHLNLNYSISP